MRRITVLTAILAIFTLGALLLSSAVVYAQLGKNVVTSPKYGNGWYIIRPDGSRTYGSAATPTTVVKGGIKDTYLAVRAQASCLGYPLDAEWRGVYNAIDQKVGPIQHFQGGDIHWNPSILKFRVSCEQKFTDQPSSSPTRPSHTTPSPTRPSLPPGCGRTNSGMVECG